ncbi:hypothetical protein GGTG_04015 [Gaeumannomyces tritici R3-111a-1]|uniref:Uncharacterized protein n=1 Tax=Gaeumannomyces tritici (strain R3-111a-1) TaxID=644352 RepID=J3NRW7_GAET3|nr:hypothetical protein GGTG_04015 [Gaeumannomyces tritici R3-111a-1]EJT78923.1 hypothetical protein GGTG_04015 [Gaeumannomyces tritici R3-111a-1]
MGYDWDVHRETCYRVYVEERRSMDELMEYMKLHHGFTPSKRAFQQQIRKWEFPSKQVGAHKNHTLVERVRQLWEANHAQREMLAVLRGEGFDVSARQLVRLRTHHRWLLRLPRAGDLGGGSDDGTSAPGADPSLSQAAKSDDTATELIIDSLLAHGREDIANQDEDDDGGNDGSSSNGDNDVTGLGEGNAGLDGDLTEAAVAVALQTAGEAATRRGRRRKQLEAESAERWESRKRRRRTRDWAGLPADPAGCPPRFPSETTLTESKALLGLDAETYSRVRRDFQLICEAEGLLRKTAAGQAAWEEAKARLVRETPHLRNAMEDPAKGEAPDADAQDDHGYGGAGGGGVGRKKQRECQNRMALALDVICTDVTKRLRASEGTGPSGRRPTLAEVKNTLGVNPDQARRMRLVLGRILAEERFTTKLEVGSERWEELKRRWQDESPELREALCFPAKMDTPGAGGAVAVDEVGKTDEEHRRLRAEKLRAVEFMARDIMKRFRDDMTRRRNRRTGSASASTETPPLPQQLSMEGEATILDPEIVGTDIGDGLDGSSDGNGYGTGLSLVVPSTPAAHLQMQHMGVALQMAPRSEQVQVQDQLPQQMHHGASQHGHGLDDDTSVMVAPGGLSLEAHMGPSLLLAADAQAAAFVNQQQYLEELQHHHHQAAVFGQHEQQHNLQQQQQPHQHDVQQHHLLHHHHHHQSHHEQQHPSLAVFLQLHPRSSIMGDFQELWVATIGGGASSPSRPGGLSLLEELKAGAVEKFVPGVVCVMVEGLVKDSKTLDDMPLQINDERELAAYLQHVDTVGGAPRFNVLLQYGVA